MAWTSCYPVVEALLMHLDVCDVIRLGSTCVTLRDRAEEHIKRYGMGPVLTRFGLSVKTFLYMSYRLNMMVLGEPVVALFLHDVWQGMELRLACSHSESHEHDKLFKKAGYSKVDVQLEKTRSLPHVCTITTMWRKRDATISVAALRLDPGSHYGKPTKHLHYKRGQVRSLVLDEHFTGTMAFWDVCNSRVLMPGLIRRGVSYANPYRVEIVSDDDGTLDASALPAYQSLTRQHDLGLKVPYVDTCVKGRTRLGILTKEEFEKVKRLNSMGLRSESEGYRHRMPLKCLDRIISSRLAAPGPRSARTPTQKFL